MRQSGRANWLVIAAVASLVALVAVLFLFSRSDPAVAAQDFMQALADHDAEKLAEITIIGNDDEATRKAKWERTLDRTKHYVFEWKVVSAQRTGDNEAAARVMIEKQANLPLAQPLPFEMPLVEVDGEWKVDAGALDRDLHPALPRIGSR